ncbi:unnamed protein product [Blepharisma stoltei]|uniref:Peptidase A1 domain-containing protein n=1 Tax=Blepharisma stoltei TaxID=1481888 RepID=A0AAU9JK03_9CILI|nr:unnamed protein product [Blepharisma stoltei]
MLLLISLFFQAACYTYIPLEVHETKAQSSTSSSKNIQTISNSPTSMENFSKNWISEYSISVKIGTPPQFFKLLINTASSWTFISEQRCPGCKKPEHLFNRTASSSYRFQSKLNDFSFENFSTTSKLSSDLMSLDNSKDQVNQIFLLGFGDTEIILPESNVDGYLGLGLKNWSYRTFPENLKIYQSAESSAFSIFLSKDESKMASNIIFGGYDLKKYAVEDSFADVEIAENDDWKIKVSLIMFGHVKICENQLALIHTGIDTILGPEKQIEELYKYLLYTYYCWEAIDSIRCPIMPNNKEPYPILYVYIESQEYSIDPSTYLREIVDDQMGNVLLVLIKKSQNLFWSLGHPFLKNYYIVFDIEEKSIGLAKSLNKGKIENEETQETPIDNDSPTANGELSSVSNEERLIYVSIIFLLLIIVLILSIGLIWCCLKRSEMIYIDQEIED